MSDKEFIIQTSIRIGHSKTMIKYYDDLIDKEKDDHFKSMIKIAREISVICLEGYKEHLSLINVEIK